MKPQEAGTTAILRRKPIWKKRPPIPSASILIVRGFMALRKELGRKIRGFPGLPAKTMRSSYPRRGPRLDRPTWALLDL